MSEENKDQISIHFNDTTTETLDVRLRSTSSTQSQVLQSYNPNLDTSLKHFIFILFIYMCTSYCLFINVNINNALFIETYRDLTTFTTTLP